MFFTILTACTNPIPSSRYGRHSLNSSLVSFSMSCVVRSITLIVIASSIVVVIGAFKDFFEAPYVFVFFAVFFYSFEVFTVYAEHFISPLLGHRLHSVLNHIWYTCRIVLSDRHHYGLVLIRHQSDGKVYHIVCISFFITTVT